MQIAFVFLGLAAAGLALGAAAGLAAIGGGPRVLMASIAAVVSLVATGWGGALLFAETSLPFALSLLTLGAAAAIYAAARMSSPRSLDLVTHEAVGDEAEPPTTDDTVRNTVTAVAAARRQGTRTTRPERRQPAPASRPSRASTPSRR